jgi:hypothetical protein
MMVTDTPSTMQLLQQVATFLGRELELDPDSLPVEPPPTLTPHRHVCSSFSFSHTLTSPTGNGHVTFAPSPSMLGRVGDGDALDLHARSGWSSPSSGAASPLPSVLDASHSQALSWTLTSPSARGTCIRYGQCAPWGTRH